MDADSSRPTRLRLDPEVETRLLALTVPDDPALTRQIMRSIARRADDSVDDDQDEEWLALQRWLEFGGERRVIDEDGFLLALAERIPVVAVRLRRDFALIRSLVFAHAILHQATRPRDEHGRVISTLDDYEAVRDLIAGIIAEGIGATVSHEVRETVTAVQSALEASPSESVVKRAQVQAELGLDDRATNRRLSQATEAGHVENTNRDGARLVSTRWEALFRTESMCSRVRATFDSTWTTWTNWFLRRGIQPPSPCWETRDSWSACTTPSRQDSSPRMNGT